MKYIEGDTALSGRVRTYVSFDSHT